MKLNPYLSQLEVDLSDTSRIIVPKGEDEAIYFEKLRASIRQHATAPDWITATVVKPGFRHRELGLKISGFLLAMIEGYWLIFQPDAREYYCFWGVDRNNLGAYGVSGNPLYSWWD